MMAIKSILIKSVSELSQLGGALTSVTDFVKPSQILSSLTGKINVPYKSCYMKKALYL
jgi:hypothetical protein